MTTSGVTSYNPTLIPIVRAALRLVGAYASTDNPRPEQMNDAIEALNMMLSSWQKNNHLWLRRFVYITLVKGQRYYDIGPTSTDLVFDEPAPFGTAVEDSYVWAADKTTLVLGSGIRTVLPGDNIVVKAAGFLLHDVAASVSGANVTLADTYLSDPIIPAASAVYVGDLYQQRPTRLFSATRKDGTTGYEIPLQIINRTDYQAIPSKTVEGRVVQVYFDPQLDNSRVYVWPTPDSYQDVLALSVDRTMQEMTSDSDTFDIPPEWVETLKYGLATRLAPEYGVPLSERQLLEAEYKSLKDSADNADREQGSVFFGVGRY